MCYQRPATVAPGLRARLDLRPAAFTDERHEDDRAVRPFGPVVGASTLDHDEVLLFAPADGYDESGTDPELLAQRIGDRRCRRGDDDAVPGRSVGIALAAVADA